jgi:hypothetical protein
VLCLVPALCTRRYRPIGVGLALLVIAAVRPGYLPQPLVITSLPLCALTIAAAIDTAWTALPARAGLLLLAAAVTVAPGWVRRDQALATIDQSLPTRGAESWLETHRQSGRLLVDDTVWADLVSRGYSSSQVVWFYKLDFVNNLDPSVRRSIHTWSDFDIVMSTPVVRSALRDDTPNSLTVVRQALQHSSVLATFGAGAQRIEIRAVHQPAAVVPAGPHLSARRP